MKNYLANVMTKMFVPSFVIFLSFSFHYILYKRRLATVFLGIQFNICVRKNEKMFTSHYMYIGQKRKFEANKDILRQKESMSHIILLNFHLDFLTSTDADCSHCAALKSVSISLYYIYYIYSNSKLGYVLRQRILISRFLLKKYNNFLLREYYFFY